MSYHIEQGLFVPDLALFLLRGSSDSLPAYTLKPDPALPGRFAQSFGKELPCEKTLAEKKRTA